MKYKALALSLLLLLPLLVIFAPKAESVNQPALWLSPKENKFYAPCIISTEFTININLFNKKEMTGVGIYAYDFKVTWDPLAGISLKSVQVIYPWPTGSYYTIANEWNSTEGWYHLAVTAVGPETLELTEVQVIIAKLTFHIDEEPCWPEDYTTDFCFENAKLSTGCGQPIEDFETDGATYIIKSSQPDIHILPATNITEKCICHTHTITIMLSNISNAYGFGFLLTFDPDYLETDVQKITICPSFPPPYEFLYMYVGDGYVWVEVIRPCEKLAVCSKDVCAVTIDFHSIADPQEGVVPFDWDFLLSIEWAYVLSKCPDPVCYDYPGDLLYGGDVWYNFRPNRADLNLDCIVDIQDLAALAGEYGNVHPWSDLNTEPYPAAVDLYDFVYVAKHYGEDP